MGRYISLIMIILYLLILPSCSSTSSFVSPVTTSPLLSLEEKLEYWGGEEVTVDQCQMFFQGEDWLKRLEEEVENSQDYILMSVFLGSSSERLENLFSIMERKAKEGVRIYLIVDGSSNMDMTDTKFVMTPLNYLRDSGINLLIYDPLSFTHIMNPSRLLVRDHRKLMVFDGKVSVIGGMNLNYISMGAGDDNQRDSMYSTPHPWRSSWWRSLYPHGIETQWKRSLFPLSPPTKGKGSTGHGSLITMSFMTKPQFPVCMGL